MSISRNFFPRFDSSSDQEVTQVKIFSKLDKVNWLSRKSMKLIVFGDIFRNQSMTYFEEEEGKKMSLNPP